MPAYMRNVPRAFLAGPLATLCRGMVRRGLMAGGAPGGAARSDLLASFLELKAQLLQHLLASPNAAAALGAGPRAGICER
jgi:hypothetical protein